MLLTTTPVFINNPGEVEVEVGSEKVSRVGTSIAGSSLEYFIIYGETPLEVCVVYTQVESIT
jgi:alpha-glucosidase (family GH31 glycosyl hydrolase)